MESSCLSEKGAAKTREGAAKAGKDAAKRRGGTGEAGSKRRPAHYGIL